jgi:hypothetical protein
MKALDQSMHCTQYVKYAKEGSLHARVQEVVLHFFLLCHLHTHTQKQTKQNKQNVSRSSLIFQEPLVLSIFKESVNSGYFQD